jgi:hypothetical protein
MNPSERIDRLIAGLADWRGRTLASIRNSILAADREIIEEWKGRASPVWSHGGTIAFANAYKAKVKLTFASGAVFPDPDKLFNADLKASMRRAIVFLEGDRINDRALKDLVLAAVDLNQHKLRKHAPAGTQGRARKTKKTDATAFSPHRS